MQDGGSGGCVPGGEGPEGAEIWSCAHCGESFSYSQNTMYIVLYIVIIVFVNVLYVNILYLYIPPLQAQYCVVFEAVLVFLDSFETYSNF